MPGVRAGCARTMDGHAIIPAGQAVELSVIVPVYRERDSLPAVLADLHQHLPGAEVVVVVRSGPEIVRSLASWVSEDPVRRRVLEQRGCGKGGAIREGLACVTAPVVAQFDSDGQFRAEDLAAAVQQVSSGQLDLCTGSRFMRGHEGSGSAGSWARRWGNRLVAAWLGVLTGQSCTDGTSGLKVWRRVVTNSCPLVDAGYCYEVELIVRAVRTGFRVGETAALESARRHGASMHAGNARLLLAGMNLLVHGWKSRWMDRPAAGALHRMAAVPLVAETTKS